MPFKSLCTVSYSPSIVTMAVSVAVCEIFSIKEWCDLENRVRVGSRSLEMAPFDSLQWQSRKTVHEWKDNSVLAKPLAACTHLSSTVSQLFEPQVQKITVFTYRSPHFCFPWRRPCNYHAICSMDGKIIQCLPNPSQHVSIYIQQFQSYTMLKSMRKSKNRYFTTFLFPLGTPLGQSC